MSKPILCLDFDGVIHSYSSKWTNPHTISDGPVDGAIPFILDALNRFDVAIYSSRSKSLRGRRAMQQWLTGHMQDFFWKDISHREAHSNHRPAAEGWAAMDIEAEYWGEAEAIVRHRIKWPWFKPSAFITIDDRALTFTGEWPALGDLASFKPWNKKS